MTSLQTHTPAVHLPEEDRAAFVMRVYQHVLAAIGAFVAIEALFFMTGVAEGIYNFFSGGKWLLMMGLFMGGQWFVSNAVSDLGNPSRQYAGLFGSSNISEEQGNIAALTTNTRALKGSNGYGTSGTNLVTSLIAVNGVPKNMSVVSGVLYNVYGGSVTVTSTGMGFAITSSALPKDACIALATRVAKNQYEQTKINSGTATTAEVTTAAATTSCSAATNTITWTVNS